MVAFASSHCLVKVAFLSPFGLLFLFTSLTYYQSISTRINQDNIITKHYTHGET